MFLSEICFISILMWDQKRGCIGIHLISYSIYYTPTDRRCAMLHSNTPPVKKRSPLTTLSCSSRCLLAEHCSTVRTSKRAGHNPESISQEAFYHRILARTSSRYHRYKAIMFIVLLCHNTIIMLFLFCRYVYSEWPHRQCSALDLTHPWTRVRAPVAAVILAICRPRSHRAIRGAQGVLPIRVGVRPVNWIYSL